MPTTSFESSRTGERYDVTFTNQPDAESRELADFTRRLGFDQHLRMSGSGGRRLTPFRRDVGAPTEWEWEDGPRVEWFRPNGTHNGFASGERIALSVDLRGLDLVRTTLHELRHVMQHRMAYFSRSEDDDAAELDAAAYAKRWAPIFLGAYKRSGGSLVNVAFTDHPPSGWAPTGALRITRGAKLFGYSRLHGWTRITRP